MKSIRIIRTVPSKSGQGTYSFLINTDASFSTDRDPASIATASNIESDGSSNSVYKCKGLAVAAGSEGKLSVLAIELPAENGFQRRTASTLFTLETESGLSVLFLPVKLGLGQTFRDFTGCHVQMENWRPPRFGQ